MATPVFKYLFLVALGWGATATSLSPDVIILSHEASRPVIQSARSNPPAKWYPIGGGRGYEISDPKQGLSVRVDTEQTTLAAGSAVEALRFTGYRPDERSTPLNARRLAIQNGQVRLNYGRGLTAWFKSTPRGVEQGFTLGREAESDSDEMELVFDIRGNLRAHLRTPQDLEFDDAGGRTRLRYTGVFAYDDQHRPLRSWMELTGHELRLAISTRGARYPITVDPLITTVTQFTDPDQIRGDNFGFNVALSADGSVALIGAFSAGANGSATGKAYVYTQTNGAWSAKPVVTWLDPQGLFLDQFGTAVALSASGTTAVISSVTHVYVYTASGGTWSATPAAVLTDPGPAGGFQDCFGCSISLSGDGTVLLIGAFGTTVNGNSDVGRVYVFTQSNGMWSTSPVAILNDPDAVTGDVFGYSVAVSADGTVALIGSPQLFGVGQAFLFAAKSGIWPSRPIATLPDPLSNKLDAFGTSVALSADGMAALVGADNSNNYSGTAYLYSSTGGVWSVTPDTVFSDPDATSGDNFGFSVALSGDATTALIGAIGALGGDGKAYVFQQLNGLWATSPTGTATLVDPQPIISVDKFGDVSVDEFGTSVALTFTGTEALVGAPQTPLILPVGSPNNTGGPGQAYVFENSNDWGYGGTTGSSGGGGFDWLCSAAFLMLLLRRKRAGHHLLH